MNNKKEFQLDRMHLLDVLFDYIQKLNAMSSRQSIFKENLVRLMEVVLNMPLSYRGADWELIRELINNLEECNHEVIELQTGHSEISDSILKMTNKLKTFLKKEK